MLIVALAAGLLTQFVPCCAFAIRSFSKVSAAPEAVILPITGTFPISPSTLSLAISPSSSYLLFRVACVCVCVCVRERERERECVCVCV